MDFRGFENLLKRLIDTIITVTLGGIFFKKTGIKYHKECEFFNSTCTFYVSLPQSKEMKGQR